MSILIKGMEMPSECARVEDGEFVHCPFVNTDDDCILQSKVTGTWEEMYQNCPLVALPDHHGRLVDAGECAEYFWEHLDDNGMAGAMNAINDMPTIVEAEGENADHE